jgi:TRAP-type C4-dicarboxylate transport system permease small subunit
MTATAATVIRAGVTQRAAERLAQWALWLAALALVGITAVQSWQVFARYVLNDSPSWTEPVAVLCMNAAMMLGAAVGVHGQRHFGFYIGVHAAPPAMQRAMLALSRAAQVAVGLMLAAWGLRLTVDTWDIPLAGVALPQGVTYVPLWAGGLLIAVFALDLLLRAPGLQVEGE